MVSACAEASATEEPDAGKLHVRVWCSEASCAILAGGSPANRRSSGPVVVISSGRQGDRPAGSLEVIALCGWGDLV